MDTVRGRYRWVLAVAMVSAAAALFVGPIHGRAAAVVGSVSVCGAGGTCCNKYGGTCYPDGCSNGSCAQPNAYWYTKGDQCPSEEE